VNNRREGVWIQISWSYVPHGAGGLEVRADGGMGGQALLASCSQDEGIKRKRKSRSGERWAGEKEETGLIEFPQKR
jgi:hypothetical protein